MPKSSTQTQSTSDATPVKKAAAARKADSLASGFATQYGPGFRSKMAKALKASVNSSRGFVVPKLTGEEALEFMYSVGGFALPSKTEAPTKKKP